MRGSSLLVVSPDPGLRASLASRFSLAGYTVTSASTGTDAVRLLADRRIDLIVVDVAIPDVHELDRDLPEFARRPPVLCMTSFDMLHTLVPEIGSRVEDYVTKPCRTPELLARVHVLLRGQAHALRYGDLALDEHTCRVWRDDRPVQVTAAEFRLLRHLLLNAGQVLSKEQLARHVWAEVRGVNAIEQLVSRLRTKVGDSLIHTRRGFGYWLGSPVA